MLGPKTNVGGVLDVVPLGEGGRVLGAFGHDAEPAVGLEGAVNDFQIPGGMVKVFEDFGGGNKVV